MKEELAFNVCSKSPTDSLQQTSFHCKILGQAAASHFKPVLSALGTDVPS